MPGGAFRIAHLALASHGLARRLGDVHRAVIVVHLDMRRMRFGGVDIEGDDRDAGALGLGDRRRKRHRVDRLQEDDRGPLADQRVHETGLHLDLVLPVEQFVVDDLLWLEDLLDSLGPRGRNRMRLPLNERHFVARAFSAGAGNADPAAVEVREQRASCAGQSGGAERHA